MTRCKNPACRKPLDPERVRKYGAQTCDPKCKAAAWKAEHNYGRHDPPPARTNGRSRSGPQVSYRRAVNLVAELLRDQAPNPERAAELLVRKLLSERQRLRLEARDG